MKIFTTKYCNSFKKVHTHTHTHTNTHTQQSVMSDRVGALIQLFLLTTANINKCMSKTERISVHAVIQHFISTVLFCTQFCYQWQQLLQGVRLILTQQEMVADQKSLNIFDHHLNFQKSQILYIIFLQPDCSSTERPERLCSTI